jgi:outer membrane receptor protein involved in Fe transport
VTSFSVCALALSLAGATLSPEQASVVSGVVRDASGAPVAGATVRTTSAADCRVETSADGAFSLDCARPGDRITVEADGLRPAIVVASDGPTRVTLETASFAEAVVVTATRGDGRTTSPAAPVSILTSSDLALAPPAPLDDVLKVVPGFSLFRRTTSRSANPTTQGAGLRGLSASGASRALVLADGEVLNDPFGGWVYWDRVPAAAIDRVEVVRGGASDLYGADALVGVIQVVTRRPSDATLRVDGAAATHDSGRLSVFGGGRRGGWTLSGAGEAATTEGYILVGEDDRGAVDTPAGGNDGVLRADIGYHAGPSFSARLGGDLFDEERENGTPLQTNSTDLRQLRVAIEGHGGDTSWRVTGQAGDQTYNQVFSSIAANRSTETLTIEQRVPASQHGLAAMVQSRIASIDLLAGADTRDVQATNIEHAYFPNGALRAVTSVPGYQRTSGLYLQGTVTAANAVTLSLGARGDVRQSARSQGLFDGDSAFSPRAAVTWAVRPSVVVRSSLGWSFRAPTLNERYRGFRAGNVVTQPNPLLSPETLRSVEGGVAWLPRRGALRVTVFRNDLDDAVTNVTIATTPDLITRRRENVGGIDAWGSEVEGEWRLSPRATLVGALALTRSRFVDYAPLEGLTVPQVPRWQGNVGIRAAGPFGLALAAHVRAFGEQFDDDRNTLILGSGAVVDVSLLRAAGHRTTLFFNLENLLDDQYEVGRSPVATYGQPFTLHGGVRLVLP